MSMSETTYRSLLFLAQSFQSGCLSILIMVGVTSTNSSSWMYSTAISKLSSRGGMTFTVSSLPAARMLVRAFVLQTFTARSPGRWWTPIIMSLYTSDLVVMNMRPLSWAPAMPKGLAVPSSKASREPFSL